MAPLQHALARVASDCFPSTKLPLGVDYGPSFIPNADVRRNVCCPQTHQSQIGQEATVTVAAQFARKQSVSVATKIDWKRTFGPVLFRWERR